MTDTATDAAAAPAASPDPVIFTGRRGELAKLLIVNSLLMIVSLSFYRFWAKTKVRQYYWRHIAIGGDPLEYTGRGLELFLGFLIAVAVLVPLGALIVVVQLYLAADDPYLSQGIDYASYAVLFWLGGYAIYRARRYRLTRTLWRGIRFGQDGKPVRYATLRFGTMLANLVTLGIAQPWTHVAVRRYEMKHTRFGFTHFIYDGRGRDLVRAWIPAEIALLAMAAIYALFMIDSWSASQTLAELVAASGGVIDGEDPRIKENLASLGAAAQRYLVWLVVPVPLFALALAYYRVCTLRYWFAASSLAGITARSALRTRDVLLYAAGALGVYILGFVLAMVLVAIGGILGGLIAIVALLSIGIVRQLFFVFPLVRRIVNTLETSDLAALDNVVQGTRDDPRFGEGLLDALDFDMGVI